MSGNPMFGAQFELMHGRPIDFFLKGGQKWTIGRNTHFFESPEEHDEWLKTTMSPTTVSRNLGKARAFYEQEMSKPNNPAEAIRKFREDPLYVSVGDSLEVARDIKSINDEMRTNSRPNPMPLYRGASRVPRLDAENNMPISFSESRHVAGHFAKYNRGEIFKVGHNEVRGLRMEDYGITPKTVGPSRISEREWLIDPSSFRSER